MAEEKNNEIKAKDKIAVATSAIKYSGNVVVKLAKGKKVMATIAQHNVGLTPLFSFFAKCLTEDFTGLTSWAPRYVEVGKYTGTGEAKAYTSCSNKVIRTTATYYGDGDIPKTTLHFRIPYSLIQDKIGIQVIRLYCGVNLGDTSKPSAEVVLDSAIENIPDNYNIVIEWTMTFADANKEEE